MAKCEEEKLNRNAEVLCNNNRFENMDEAKKGNVQITTGLGCHEWNSQKAHMKNRTLYVTGLYTNQRAIVYFNSLAPPKKKYNNTRLGVYCGDFFSSLNTADSKTKLCENLMFNSNLVCYLLSVFYNEL